MSIRATGLIRKSRLRQKCDVIIIRSRSNDDEDRRRVGVVLVASQEFRRISFTFIYVRRDPQRLVLTAAGRESMENLTAERRSLCWRSRAYFSVLIVSLNKRSCSYLFFLSSLSNPRRPPLPPSPRGVTAFPGESDIFWHGQ